MMACDRPVDEELRHRADHPSFRIDQSHSGAAMHCAKCLELGHAAAPTNTRTSPTLARNAASQLEVFVMITWTVRPRTPDRCGSSVRTKKLNKAQPNRTDWPHFVNRSL